jgi:hypothetical protein
MHMMCALAGSFTFCPFGVDQLTYSPTNNHAFSDDQFTESIESTCHGMLSPVGGDRTWAHMNL